MDIELQTDDDLVFVRMLGKGSMGEVRLAQIETLGGLVALKNVGPCDDHALAESKLGRESATLKQLDHPGIVRHLGTLRFRGQFVMVQEFVDGITFRQWFHRLLRIEDGAADFDPLPGDWPARESEEETARFVEDPGEEEDAEGEAMELPAEAKRLIATSGHVRRCCELVRQAAEGAGPRPCARRLAPRPEAGKPHARPGRPGAHHRFRDRPPSRALTLSQTRAILAPLYMSPEHITGRINVNEKSDVFSLGIVLYEAPDAPVPLPARLAGGPVPADRHQADAATPAEESRRAA